MLQVNNVGLRFGSRTLFRDVNLKFEHGNCYGLIGANGAGKSTFLKILSREIEPTSGDISIGKNERLSVLKQNHQEYDKFSVMTTVIMGNKKLYDIMQKREAMYEQTEFTESDGILIGELEAEFADLNGWEAESNAAILLAGLGLANELHEKKMEALTGPEKVKVLLAQALFDNPDVLLLDEPTNNLDITAKLWLEEFLINFPNTVIVVSHDRHFLNKVCTHTIDIDFEKLTLFVGNYDFWYESSQLILKQMKDSNKKKEDKIKELQDFIRRFSANASKSKQATSRKRSLEKIELDEIKPSTRKYPFINFKIERPLGKEVLEIKGLTKKMDDSYLLKDFTLSVSPGEKIALVGNEQAITMLFKILNEEDKVDKGYIKWGQTVSKGYYPKNYDKFFTKNVSLVDWLKDYSSDTSDIFLRGFLGRMLFSGEEALKMVKVLSGGEKVRCMFAKLMLCNANVLMFDDPTNHLDIEAITSLNNEMINYQGCILFSSHDHHLLNSVADRIIEIKEDGKYIDKKCTYDEYLNLN